MAQLGVFIVDNPHPTHGSSTSFITEKIIPRSGTVLPALTLLPQTHNKGFAGGNNVGIRAAIEAGFDYVYLHNQDGFMAPDCLSPLVTELEGNSTAGVAQSLIMLCPETNLINSAGNCWHYLGFGYSGKFRQPRTNAPHENSLIGYASGAGLLLRVSVLLEHGLLDEDLFAYHEDLEYSLRLKSRGLASMICPKSIFYHEYSFSRNAEKFYLMERNRYALILVYYSWPMIVLLLPVALAVEIGMLGFALRGGWLKQKMRVYWYWLRFSHWKIWLKKRHENQEKRRVSDREIFDMAVSTIEFDNELTNGWLLTSFANPVLRVYWWLIRFVY